jgi:hypothetical protein
MNNNVDDPAAAVENFNAAYAEGDPMVYRSRPGAEPVLVHVAGAAYVLSGHTAVVFVSGHNAPRACVALSALEPYPGTAPRDPIAGRNVAELNAESAAAERDVFTGEQRLAIGREVCAGVARARPGHRQLDRDIEAAAFVALRSPTFRKLVHDLCADGHPLARRLGDA